MLKEDGLGTGAAGDNIRDLLIDRIGGQDYPTDMSVTDGRL